MALRTQIELSKENIRKLTSVKSRCRLNLSLTLLANEAIDLGLPKVTSNLYNAKVFQKKGGK